MGKHFVKYVRFGLIFVYWNHIVFNAPVTELVYVLVLEAKF